MIQEVIKYSLETTAGGKQVQKVNTFMRGRLSPRCIKLSPTDHASLIITTLEAESTIQNLPTRKSAYYGGLLSKTCALAPSSQ